MKNKVFAVKYVVDLCNMNTCKIEYIFIAIYHIFVIIYKCMIQRVYINIRKTNCVFITERQCITL